MRIPIIAALLLLTSACGLDPNKIPSTRIYADDGETASHERYINFAVVGQTRVPVSAVGEPEGPKQVIGDIRAEKPVRDLSFAALMGGMVSRSKTGEWTNFAERWAPILHSDVISDNQSRIPALPMVGRGELVGDKRLKGMGAAFRGTGADIGLNRVASWSRVDLHVGKTRWRMVFLDTNRDKLGSRWDEQLYWLPGAVSGDGYDQLIVFLSEPRFSTAKSARMTRDGAAAQLLDTIDKHSDLLKLTAVFSGGPATNEAYLPTGEFGELHIVAGNGGIGGETFTRGASASEAGIDDNLTLEPVFTRVLLSAFSAAAKDLELGDKVKEAVAGTEGKPPEFPGGDFPVQGWWSVTLGELGMSVTFRMRAHDGSFSDAYKAVWTSKGGWKAEAL